MAKPEVLNILVDEKYDNSSASLTPIISWHYYDPDGDEQDSFRLKIGTSRGKYDILDTGTVSSSSFEYLVTSHGYSSLLKHGLKYYITLVVSNSYGESESFEETFFTSGNYWDNYVDNLNGWTIEFYYKMDSIYSSISSFDEQLYPHHDIEIRDGSYSFYVEFFVDRILLKTSETSSYFIDTTKYHLYRITGQDNNVKLYVDGSLAVDVVGKNTIETSFSNIKISSVSNNLPVTSTWAEFSIDLDGAFPPENVMTESEVSSLFFNDEEVVDFIFDKKNKNSFFVATNPNDIGESGKIYKVSKNSYLNKFQTSPVVGFEPKKIQITSDNSKWAISKNKLFKISGEKIDSFDQEINLDSESNLDEFIKIENCSKICGVFDDFLRIDNTTEGDGKVWYYQSLKNDGNLWFLNVDNSLGWAVESNIRIASDMDSDYESAGLIINDGKHEETFYIFEDRIVLLNSNISALYDFSSSFVTIRFVGKEDDIFVYVKNGSNWNLLIDGKGKSIGKAQIYSDSSSESLANLYGDRSYAIWHSNKSGNWQIYLSEYNGINWELEKQLTYDSGNRMNPSIIVDSNNIAHIVYQDNQFGNNEIVYAKYNGYSIYEKIRITDSTGDSVNPVISMDNEENIYIVWLDNRLGNYHVYSAKYIANEKKWYSSHHDEEDYRISGFSSSYNASFLKIKSFNDYVAVVWQDDRNSIGNIYFSYYDGEWSKETLVSNPSYSAHYPDLSIDSFGTYYFAWQDGRFGNNQIYYKNYSSSFSPEVRISNSSNNSRYPSISISKDSEEDIHIFWLENVSGINAINMRRTVGKVWNSFTESLETSSYENIFSINSISFSINRKIQLLFSSNNQEGYKSIYSAEIYVPKSDSDLSFDISSISVEVSNNKNTKCISFGNISSYNQSVSEWKYLKYYTEGALSPLIISSWDFNSLEDFFIDCEENIYTIDNNGLEIYGINNSYLIQNEEMKKSSIQSPENPTKIFVDSFCNIFLACGDRLYRHYGLFSDLIDEDHRWMEIKIDYSMGDILSIDEDTKNKNICIGFDNGAIFIERDLLFKNNIINDSNSTAYVYGSKINGFSFSDSHIYMASNYGIYKINRNNSSIVLLSVEDGLLDQSINQVKSVSDDVFWATGPRGLVKIENDSVSIYRKKLSSDMINGFSIDLNGNLWIANELGIDFFKSSSNYFYLINEKDGLTSPSGFINYKSYKILTDMNISNKYYHIVKINGSYRNQSLYYFDSINNLIIFNNRLSSSDVVELLYFDYMELLFDLSDPKILLDLYASGVKRLTGFSYGISDDEIIASFVMDGDSYIYKFSVGEGYQDQYPFSTIIYDKTPPIGTVDIINQISYDQVSLAISASDNVSGVENMIISKYSNFTSDGSSPLSPIPYSEFINYNIGSSIGVGQSNHEFSDTYGSVLHVFEKINENTLQSDLYAGSSNPAQIYKFDKENRLWENVENINAEQIFCMTSHMGRIYVGTGDTGKIFVSSNGNDYSILTQLADSFVYSLLSASDDKLYIGTGNSGKLYVYDGNSVSLLFDFNETSINDMVEFSGYIYMATGDNGRIYRYNLSSKSKEIIYDDIDSNIFSIGIGKDFNLNSETVYAGTGPSGKILRLISSRDLFVKSFESTCVNCYSINGFFNSENNSILDSYACVDNKLLKLGEKSWSIIYSDENNYNIKDIKIFNGEIFIISDNNIKTLKFQLDKYIYIKFIDYAGNETILYDSDGNLKPRSENERLYDILSIEDMDGLSLKNRILVVNNSYSIEKVIEGDIPFLSADRIDQETAVYVSEIFNGTNNLISWDKLTYSGYSPAGTSIILQLRSAQEENLIDSEDWSDPVLSGQDISGLSGQFIQFKATLLSEVRGITPVLHNVTITSKSTFAVHYFTSNFTLSSNLKSGIMTANTVIPSGTEIVFGVTSDTSTDWNDYQIVELNKVFYMDDTNLDNNLKVGVKFLSNSQEVAELHEFGIMFTTESGDLVKLNLNQE